MELLFQMQSKQGIEVVRWRKNKGKTFERVGPKLEGWVKLNQISLHMIHAILVSEDARFYEHAGLDYHEIWISLLTNIEHKKILRGASTITQQVVKIAYLDNKKSFIRKLREMLGAIILENILTKEEILEWYLNILPLGESVYGVQEGAKAYFDIRPELLTIVQATNLALILPSPNRWSKGLREHKLSPIGRRRFTMILSKMLEEKYITLNQWQHSMAKGDFGSPVGFEPS